MTHEKLNELLINTMEQVISEHDMEQAQKAWAGDGDLRNFPRISWDWGLGEGADNTTGEIHFDGVLLGTAKDAITANKIVCDNGCKVIPEYIHGKWYAGVIISRIGEALHDVTTTSSHYTNVSGEWLEYAYETLVGQRGAKFNPFDYPLIFDFWANTPELKELRNNAIWEHISAGISGYIDGVDGPAFWGAMDPYGLIGTWDQIRAHYMERSYRVAYDIYAQGVKQPNLFTNNN